MVVVFFVFLIVILAFILLFWVSPLFFGLFVFFLFFLFHLWLLLDFHVVVSEFFVIVVFVRLLLLNQGVFFGLSSPPPLATRPLFDSLAVFVHVEADVDVVLVLVLLEWEEGPVLELFEGVFDFDLAVPVDLGVDFILVEEQVLEEVIFDILRHGQLGFDGLVFHFVLHSQVNLALHQTPKWKRNKLQ